MLICPRLVAGTLAGLVVGAALGQVELSRAEYQDRLHGMWLGESIANWTGLRGEGQRTSPPFATDEDWGTNLGRGVLKFVVDLDPWPADDDTDIEYVYMHLMGEHGVWLSGDQIADGWEAHINRFIWVSNARARELMEDGAVPRSTGLAMANAHWLKIDAQLTTEMFGAIAPGMPGVALELADLAIGATSAGHASHASQFFVVLYSLAARVDPDLAAREQMLWLIEEARRYIPDSSKAADIVDFVTADYLANPNVDDWERTRDKIYERYHAGAGSNGFRYRSWVESSVNFATGIMCLLYGEGDFKRTIQIGTLSGWDADNPTSTMGGLLGLMHGRAWVAAQFPDETLSDRYWILRTRDAMPDYLPEDPEAEDTFGLIAERMLSLVDQAVRSGGGVVDGFGGGWMLPPVVRGDELEANPLVRLDARSANNNVRRAGGTVTAESSVSSSPTSGGVGDPSFFANGFHTDYSGIDPLDDSRRRYYSTEHAGANIGDWQTLTVTYDRPVQVHTVRFIEGEHFHGSPDGGWFEAALIEVRVGGVWISPEFTAIEQLGSARPYQIIDFVLDETLEATGIRLIGSVGGSEAFATCAELDALAQPLELGFWGFDVNRDGEVDAEDLHEWHASPADLNGDGEADTRDLRLLEGAARWHEDLDLASPGRR